VSDDFLKLLAIGCPELKELVLHRCVGISDAGVAAMMMHCTKLTELYVTACRGVSVEMHRTVEQRYSQNRVFWT
jgi:hypothetical protein